MRKIKRVENVVADEKQRRADQRVYQKLDEQLKTEAEYLEDDINDRNNGKDYQRTARDPDVGYLEVDLRHKLSSFSLVSQLLLNSESASMYLRSAASSSSEAI